MLMFSDLMQSPTKKEDVREESGISLIAITIFQIVVNMMIILRGIAIEVREYWKISRIREYLLKLKKENSSKRKEDNKIQVKTR